MYPLAFFSSQVIRHQSGLQFLRLLLRLTVILLLRQKVRERLLLRRQLLSRAMAVRLRSPPESGKMKFAKLACFTPSLTP